MKVLLVDDNRLMLEGLENLLATFSIEIAGTAANGFEALEKARSLSPDIILMDIRMPKCDGLSATRLIKAEMPEAKIVILTTSTEDNDLFEAVKSGASGYLVKSMDAQELVEALEQTEQGIPPFSPGLARKLLEQFAALSRATDTASAEAEHSHQDCREAPLTSRQLEVLRLVSEGLTYKQVGVKLSLSPRTVKYHMVEIIDRLHMENRAQVLAYAARMAKNEPNR